MTAHKPMKFRDRLKAMAACYAATEWVGRRSLARAWAECPRGDWMLWLAARVGVERGIYADAYRVAWAVRNRDGDSAWTSWPDARANRRMAAIVRRRITWRDVARARRVRGV